MKLFFTDTRHTKAKPEKKKSKKVKQNKKECSGASEALVGSRGELDRLVFPRGPKLPMERRMVRLRGDGPGHGFLGVDCRKNLAFPCAWYRKPEALRVVLIGSMLGV